MWDLLHRYILNTDPIGGVELTVYDYQQQPIGSGNTDNQGIAAIKCDGLPFVVTAKKGLQTGYLKLDDGSSLSLSNFDITGSKVQNGIKGFIYGERGVWRPADTVHLAFIMAAMNEHRFRRHSISQVAASAAAVVMFAFRGHGSPPDDFA